MLWRIAGAAVGMVLFAFCSHQGGAWAIVAAGGLILTGASVVWEGRTAPVGPLEVFGFRRLTAAGAAWALAGFVLGAGAGAWHRYGLDLPLWPQGPLQAFVVVACLVGAAEELLFRGWLLGQARAYGWPAAIGLAAVSHAAYKTALFAWPPAPIAVDLWWLMLLTMAGGIVLGVLRTASRSVIPAVAAHAAFDLVVYGSLVTAPWWVWG